MSITPAPLFEVVLSRERGMRLWEFIHGCADADIPRQFYLLLRSVHCHAAVPGASTVK